MHSFAHEACASGFFEVVRIKLMKLCSSSEEREFARKIRNYGAATVKSRDTGSQDKYKADASIAHMSKPLYGLSLEVAYSQKRDKLSEKAKFYLLESVQETSIVVGIDYDYGRTEKVTLLTWRRDGNELTLCTQVRTLSPRHEFLLTCLGSTQRRRHAYPG